jgi:hypothetical protein
MTLTTSNQKSTICIHDEPRYCYAQGQVVRTDRVVMMLPVHRGVAVRYGLL